MTAKDDGRRRIVNVKKGQTIEIRAGRGVVLAVTRYASGAVELVNENSRGIIRLWTPKEAKQP